MKKLFYLSLIAGFIFGSFTFVSCGDDEEEGPNQQDDVVITQVDLIGSWKSIDEGYQVSVSFTNDKMIFTENGQMIGEYAYTLKDGVVTIDMDQRQMVSVPCPLYGKSVLVFKAVSEGTNDHLAYILVKDGAQIPVTAKDIQGFWCWYEDTGTDLGEIIRVAIKLDGKNFEFTITPWGERYIGTYTYQNGLLRFNVTEALTSREEGTGFGEMWGRMDPKTLECDSWAPLYEEHWHIDAMSGNPFIVCGKEAYGIVANIPCIFQIKK